MQVRQSCRKQHLSILGNKSGLTSEIYMDIEYHMTTNLLVTNHITGLTMPDLLWCRTLMNLSNNLDLMPGFFIDL
jgi:hypothetical protein